MLMGASGDGGLKEPLVDSEVSFDDEAWHLGEDPRAERGRGEGLGLMLQHSADKPQ